MKKQTKISHEFYGYQMIQNPSNAKFALYVGAADAKPLRDLVSVDNAVNWDSASGNWCTGGRNRTVITSHWESILEFLQSNNNERILPSSIIISVAEAGFKFKPFTEMKEKHRTVPGVITLTGLYHTDPESGEHTPVAEKERFAWVLDGQHRIRAFRGWSMPDPYPVNVVIIKQWKGSDYEDSMRHQTYELNMGRPLDNNFKASIRERYDSQVGHGKYKKEIALSWIRADMESRGEVFSSDGVVGATSLRTPFLLQMHTLEKLIEEAFNTDVNLYNEYNLKTFTKADASKIGEYLFNFFEGVRLSIGKIHSSHYAYIGSEEGVADCKDYWQLAKMSGALAKKQRLVHNVGLRAIVNGLLVDVMTSLPAPSTPQEVADRLVHMEGIPWFDGALLSKKDDWVTAIGEGLNKMFRSIGTKGRSKKYTLEIVKKAKDGTSDAFKLVCLGT
jgi:hypothetical protein